MRRDEAAAMMTALIRDNGLDKDGWSFAWMNRMRTLGLCKYGSKQLLLSLPYVDRHDRDHVEQTCLHEVAHALTPGAKHGPEWQMIARQLGVENPQPCTEADMPEGRWVAEHTCGSRYSMHRPPRPAEGPGGRFYYCPKCWKAPDFRFLPKEERRAVCEIFYVDTVSAKLATLPRNDVSVPVSAVASSPVQTDTPSAVRSPNTFTAPQVAAAMKVEPKKFRAWLRRWSLGSNYQTGPGGAYVFTQDDVREVVKAWNATH